MTSEGWIEFKNQPDTVSFFDKYAREIGRSSPHLKFKATKQNKDERNIIHQRYQLYYKNVEVEGIEFILHSQNGKVKTANGKTIDGLDFDMGKKINEKQAIQAALQELKLSNIKPEKVEADLVITKIDIDDWAVTNFRLAYKMNLTKPEPMDFMAVYVEAYTGKIIKTTSLIHKCFDPNCKTDQAVGFGMLPSQVIKPAQPLLTANFVPFYSPLYGTGAVSFETEPLGSNQRLALTTARFYPNYTQTLTAALWTKRYTTQALFQALLPQFLFPNTNPPSSNDQDAAWYQQPEVQNSTGNWNTVQQEATTTHWAAQKTYEYYLNNHGRYGPANNGLVGRFITNVPQNIFPSGFFGPFNISFGNGNGWDLTVIQSTTGESWGTLDIIAHELTHSFTRNSSNLYYGGESGAINEAISDIIGTSVERKTITNWDWLVANEIPSIPAIRSMQNPLLFNDPEIYNGANWRNTNPNANDNGGVHHNSGVMNKWFWLLNTGGWFNGRFVKAINPDHAEKIVFVANANYLQQYDNYAQLAFTTREVARILYGQCSNEHRAVSDAWAAVGVGGGSECPVDCNYTVTTTSSNANPAPSSSITLTANCSGSGCDGISYNWQGNGTNQNGQSVTISAPSTVGSYIYTNYITKLGCNFDYKVVTVNVGNTSSTCANVGSISYDRWNNIGGGNSVQDLRNNTNNLQNAPTVSQNLSVFQAPSNICDYCGTRIRGYVCPPTSGSYTFWVEGDDNTELWLSTTDQPANVQKIAYHNDWTGSLEWNKYGTQQSAPINLQAGQRYYIEALVKEGGGGDNLAVGWQLPNGALERPISSNRIIPFSGVSNPPPPPPTNCASGNFGGHLDVANCNVFAGWALDHNNYGRTVQVNIFVDGVFVGFENADQNRQDLAQAFGNPAAAPHGWTYTVPANASWRNGTNRNVTARICGATSDLGNTPQTVNCTGGSGTPPPPSPPPPTTCAGGNFNGHFDSGNCGIFNGWALDMNNYGRTLEVDIYVDGTFVKRVQAFDSRPDLGAYFGNPAATPHGWHYNPLPTDPWRNGIKTVSARICGASSDLYNSPKTVNFTNCRIGVINNNEGNEENEENEENDLILSPNPTDGELRFRLGLGTVATDVLVSLSDLAGRTLQTKVYKNRQGQLDERLDLGTLPSGSYIFGLQTTQAGESQKRFSKKVLVVR